MKKIIKITLVKEELKSLKGSNKEKGEPPISPKGICGCNCYNCIWADGGGGFSVGMIYSNIY